DRADSGERVVSAHHVLARPARGHLRDFVNHEDRKAMTTCHPGALRASRPNRGQALVLLSLFLIVLLAVLGLGVDGGNLYLQRRGVQLAADASALAGARLMGTPTSTGPARSRRRAAAAATACSRSARINRAAARSSTGAGAVGPSRAPSTRTATWT